MTLAEMFPETKSIHVKVTQGGYDIPERVRRRTDEFYSTSCLEIIHCKAQACNGGMCEAYKIQEIIQKAVYQRKELFSDVIRCNGRQGSNAFPTLSCENFYEVDITIQYS